ncbi:polynucleotide adenylyltransferase [Ranunculus cassubicifolius]
MAIDSQDQEQSYIIAPTPFLLIPPPTYCFFPPPGSIAVSNPNLNRLHLIPMEEQRTNSLLQFMLSEGLIPTVEDEFKREDVIRKLKKIVIKWIQRVAWQRGHLGDIIDDTSATIVAYGSYGLGAHGPESDIDAVCVGPSFATLRGDFFIVLHNMLQNTPEVSDMHCVKDAKIPMMRFKYNGISIDLPYVRLQESSVPDNVNILCPSLLNNIDETSWRSLSGLRANTSILQLVPNVEKFQTVLRCLKFWARRRGVYCNLVGFFAGIHIAVLAAYVCQRHPNASISFLLSNFFETFALWTWPDPVLLVEEEMLPGTARCLMPIQLPGNPNEYCFSNATRSTFQRIRTELLRGHTLTRVILGPDFNWRTLFEPFPYSKKYKRFVRILLTAKTRDKLGDWVGWVKSRFRSLLLKLEEVQGLCDPNPTEYMDPDVESPNTVFYWGLQAGRSSFKNPCVVEEHFRKLIVCGCQGAVGTIELSILDSSQLPKYAQQDSGSWGGSKAYWRVLDYRRSLPIYSYYVPNYVVGYMATNGGGEYPSAGG